MAKTAADLSTSHKTNYNQLGSGSQALVHFDLAVSGPGIIQAPTVRVMTGAMSSAQATEQTTAITAGGGMASFAGKDVSEAGRAIAR